MPPSSSSSIIRPLCTQDDAALAALEFRCLGAARWGEAGYQQIGTNGIVGAAAEVGGVVVGFVVYRIVADEMEILNLAVDPEARRQGIGSSLVGHAIERARGAEAKHVYLEVRESNAGARGFYAAASFAENGRRKDYYSQPVEDALVLVLHID
jgi:ribosomal-protein-alanine N-acetyltransferase